MSDDRYDKVTAALVGRKLHALADEAYDPETVCALRNAAHQMDSLTGFTRPEDYVEAFKNMAWKARFQANEHLEEARHDENIAKAYEAASEACQLLASREPEAVEVHICRIDETRQ